MKLRSNTGGGALRRPFLVLGALLLSGHGLAAQDAGLVRDLLPFRFTAVSGFELDATVNGVRRTDLDVRRPSRSYEFEGRLQLNDRGMKGPCGDTPRDAQGTWEYEMRPLPASHGLRFSAKTRISGRIGGLPAERPACPVSDVRILGGLSRLGVALTSDHFADSTDRGAWWLVLYDETSPGPPARARRAAGAWQQPLTWTAGASLYAAGDERGDELWIGLSSEIGIDHEARAAAAASHCGACAGARSWPRDTFFVTTLGHAIHAVGLSPTADNRGRATFDVEVPFDTFLVKLDAVTHQRGVWICDFRPSCEIPEGHLALHDVRLSGSGNRAFLTMRVQRRQSALSGGWSPTYFGEVIVATRMEHFSFLLGDIQRISLPGADPAMQDVFRIGVQDGAGYPLFPSFTGTERFVRRFETTCLFPETERATIESVVSATTLRLRLKAPVNIQARVFCPAADSTR